MIKALFGKPRVIASFRSPVCRAVSNYLYKKPEILKLTNFSFERQMDFEMSLMAKCQVSPAPDWMAFAPPCGPGLGAAVSGP